MIMTKIYIENLPLEVENKDLKEKFEAFGEVETAHIITDKETGISRCFGFVEMPSRKAAEEAIAGLRGTEWNEKILVVNESMPKERI